MDTKALRQKILDLAIRGKLVPQDPNDEPASVLLERIRAEKERLIAEGKIKRSKKSKASSSESHYQNFTPPFPIPDSWEWVRLEEIAYVASGSTPAKEYFKESGIPYLKMYNLRNQKIDFLFKPQYITKEIHNGKLAKSKAYSGDLIMNIVGPPLGKLAIIPNEIAECNFNQAAVVIRPYSEKNLINKYLFYYLSQMSEINSITTKGTAGQDNISLTQSQNMRIPVPPLCEMYRLVDKLDQYAELIGNLNDNALSIRSKIGTIKSKILELAMQGRLVPQDPTDEPAADMLRRVNPKARIITDNPHYPQLPDNWVWISIEDLNEYKPKSINPAESPSEIFDLYSVPIFPTGHPEKVIGKEIGSTKQSVQYGDVLLCKINPHLNRVWTIEVVSDNMQIASSEWIVIRSSSTYSTYLRWLFSSPFFRKLLCSQVSGVGGSLTRAQPAVVKKYLIPIPPYNEQIRIVSKIVELLSALTDIDSNLAD